jgi:hypothetical protein
MGMGTSVRQANPINVGDHPTRDSLERSVDALSALPPSGVLAKSAMA